jgi:Holliday junction resolvasome RuvABC DNA-binding subunit
MEAVSALMVLGYSSNEAMSAIRVVNNGDISLEDLIRLSLKQLVKQI